MIIPKKRGSTIYPHKRHKPAEMGVRLFFVHERDNLHLLLHMTSIIVRHISTCSSFLSYNVSLPNFLPRIPTVFVNTVNPEALYKPEQTDCSGEVMKEGENYKRIPIISQIFEGNIQRKSSTNFQFVWSHGSPLRFHPWPKRPQHSRTPSPQGSR